jgi:hypothetical protein
MQFNGIIITDALDMLALSSWSHEERAVKAFQAGCDILLAPVDVERVYAHLLRAFKNGQLSEQELDKRVVRIIRLKMKLGIIPPDSTIHIPTHRAHRAIFECERLEEIFDYLPSVGHEQLLITLDIDNTLAVPGSLDIKEGPTDVGSEEFVYLQAYKLRESGISEEETHRRIHENYFFIQHHSTLKPTQDNCAAVVKHLQQQGCMVIGLTSRSPCISGITIEKLNALNIDFAFHHIHPSDTYTWNTHGHKEELLHEKGILFCASNEKGKSLTHLCKNHQIIPQCIIAIDNNKKHLVDIAHAVEQWNYEQGSNIRFFGLRYSGCDKHAKHFYSTHARQKAAFDDFELLVETHGKNKELS